MPAVLVDCKVSLEMIEGLMNS